MKKRFGLLSLIGAVAVLVALMGVMTALADGPPVVLLDTEVLVVGGDAIGSTLVGTEATQVFTIVGEVASVSAVLGVTAAPPPDGALIGAGILAVEQAVYTAFMVVILAVTLAFTMPTLQITLTHLKRIRHWRFVARGWLSYHNPNDRSHILMTR